jgi:hypothetical protein
MTAETTITGGYAVSRRSVEITDEDENIIIAFIPLAASLPPPKSGSQP